MPSDPTAALFDAVRDLLAAVAPRRAARRVKLTLDDGSKLSFRVDPAPACASPDTAPAARHSTDFRSVRWFGADYTFSPTQAAVVRSLWEAWEDGTPDLSQEALTEAAGSERGRVRDIFRDHPAWQTFIVSRSKGTFRLAEPS